MSRNTLVLVALAALFSLPVHASEPAKTSTQETPPFQLGNFSFSLAVQEIHASKAFYTKLVFEEVFCNIEQ
ncbi:MAG: hypothetical protein AAFY88_31345, partial [Acidobacteriota bacterium]